MEMHQINKPTVNSQSSFLTVSMLLIKFDCLLKFVCNPNIHMRGTCIVIFRYVQSSENFEPPNAQVPSDVGQDVTLPSCLSFHM